MAREPDRPVSARAAADLRRLVDLVARLRAPDGCPWDREQTLADARTHLIEEAHEAAAAAADGDWERIAAELGDLLFQVAFVARLGEEAGELDSAEVVERIRDKMIGRHPHVFGGEEAASAEEVLARWEESKLREPGREPSLLAGVPDSLPPLVAAYRISQKAAGVGFDWPGPEAVLEKLEEELGELRGALERGESAAVRDEIGDLLFTLVNLARKLGVDPDAALAGTNAKFRRRFGHVERRLEGEGTGLAGAGLEAMEAVWREAKESEARNRRAEDGPEDGSEDGGRPDGD